MSQSTEPITRSEAESPLFVGVGLEGGGLRLGVVDNRGRLLAQLDAALAADEAATGKNPAACGLEDVLRRADAAVAEIIAQADLSPDAIAGVGVGLPGSVDPASGQYVEPLGFANGWQGFPVRARFGALGGRPTSYANDAVAAACGEAWLGAGQAMPSIVLLTLGARVGCGVLFGDNSIDGQGNYGVELSHMIIDYRDCAPQCVCGQRGHLAAHIDEAAVLNRAQQALGGGNASSLTAELAQGQSLTVAMIAAAAAAGDAVALDVVSATARYLGVGIVNIMNTIDSDGVLLAGPLTFGGAAAPLGQQFLTWIKEEVRRRAFASIVDHTVIDFAALDAAAIYLGPAALARLNKLGTLR